MYKRLCGQRLVVLAALFCDGSPRPLRFSDIRRRIEQHLWVGRPQLSAILKHLVLRGYAHKWTADSDHHYLYRLTIVGRREFEDTCRLLDTIARQP